MSALDVLGMCQRRGIALAAVGDRLKVVAPAGAVDDDLRLLLANHKAELLTLVASCPSCRRPLDHKRRCWQCEYRACEMAMSEDEADVILRRLKSSNAAFD